MWGQPVLRVDLHPPEPSGAALEHDPVGRLEPGDRDLGPERPAERDPESRRGSDPT